jgi:peptidoglycan/LPS O-acetylase OafA/YrhL
LLLSAAVILLLTSPRDGCLKRFFCSRWCVFLGERCYSLYLWHWPIIWLLLVETEATKITILLIAIPLTLLLSSLTYAFVEVPFLSKMSRVRRIEGDPALPSS